jgi:outer membrane protein TolC
VQYKAGLADFTTVLTSERDLHAVEDEKAQSRVNVTTDMIALYKALGGGWEIAPAAPSRKQ